MGSQLGQFVPGHLVYSDVSYPYNYLVQVVYHIGSFQKYGIMLSMVVQDLKKCAVQSCGTSRFICFQTTNFPLFLALWEKSQARGSKGSLAWNMD